MKKAIALAAMAGLVYALVLPGVSVWAKNSVAKPVAAKQLERDRQLADY